MKFLIDECAESVPLRRALLELGHDVLSVRDQCPQAIDDSLLVTEGKDLGNSSSYGDFRIPESCVSSV